MKKLLIGLVLFASFKTNAQQKTDPATIKEKMQWFADAKLGIFIHWGIYAVADVSESWSFHNKQISWKDYMNQANSFTAAKISAECSILIGAVATASILPAVKRPGCRPGPINPARRNINVG